MTIAELKEHIRVRLTPSEGENEARSMLRIILEDVVGINPVDALIDRSRAVEPETVERVDKILTRVANGEPLQYVLGSTDFHGLKLDVNPAVLIPRPETSFLIDIIEKDMGDKKDLRVLDVGTGSGAIALVLARILPFSKVIAIDNSRDALHTAKHNAERLNIRNIEFSLRDVLTEGLPKGTFELIVSNPPYVTQNESLQMEPRVLDYEPHNALFVPDDNPLVFYDKIAAEATKRADKELTLYFEINPLFANQLRKMLNDKGYEDVEILRDFRGSNRYARAVYLAR